MSRPMVDANIVSIREFVGEELTDAPDLSDVEIPYGVVPKYYAWGEEKLYVWDEEWREFRDFSNGD